MDAEAEIFSSVIKIKQGYDEYDELSVGASLTREKCVCVCSWH